MNQPQTQAINSYRLSLADRQHAWLAVCLKRNAHSLIGRRYAFSSITSINDYQSRVPITDYEDIRSLVDRIAAGEANILFSGTPVAFERTSGSARKSKLIPYSSDSLVDYQRAIAPWLSSLVDSYQLSGGSSYWSLSPVSRIESTTAAGIPIGLPDTAYLGDAVKLLSGVAFAVPAWVAQVKNIKQWKLFTLYWLLVHDDLLFISVWSPSFLSVLLDAITEYASALRQLLFKGGTYAGHAMPANEVAFNRLGRFVGTGDYRVLWPRLKLVSCWGDASSGKYLQQLQSRLPYVVVQPKGLLMTEAVVTVPDTLNHPVLAVDSGFYEFINDDGVFLAHQLEDENCYEVVVTTSGGLYRYRTYDRVQCEGYRAGSPVLRFIGRNGIQSDLVGEKLTEDFVSGCLAFISGFSMLVPTSGPQPCYRLVLDKADEQQANALARQTEQALLENPQYAYARKLRQLAAVTPVCLPVALNTYVECMRRSGIRYGDIKMPALSTKPEWLKVINEDYS